MAADSALRRLLREPPRALLDFDLKLKAPTLTVEARPQLTPPLPAIPIHDPPCLLRLAGCYHAHPVWQLPPFSSCFHSSAYRPPPPGSRHLPVVICSPGKLSQETSLDGLLGSCTTHPQGTLHCLGTCQETIWLAGAG